MIYERLLGTSESRHLQYSNTIQKYNTMDQRNTV